jgi:membrane protease YdiL (CAAX protease family)
MNATAFFFNEAGRLRSGWRLFTFAVVYILVIFVVFTLVGVALVISPGFREFITGHGAGGFIFQAVILLTTATLVGWGCAKVLEDLPFKSLGWALHKGWIRDWALGSLFGCASLVFAAAIATIGGATIGGGYRFSFAPDRVIANTAQTILLSAAVFVLAGAAEEALFRGYPLQTVLRSWRPWAALIPTSLAFASVHVSNPNVMLWATLGNTTLAGVWLAVAYTRTRSLWFPMGIHWSWNWTMGAVLGLPVSGIESLTPNPLLRATDQGPVWLTGGAYGIEGGVACTIALIVSTIAIYLVPFLSASPEMTRFTHENPPTLQPGLSIKLNSPD